MKKRIFAASMASVMALSSVSVVAFADETKADYGEAVTKAELKEYIKSLEKFVDDELDEYGTTMGENFTGAYEAAKVVAEDSDADAEDVVAAYQMLKAVKAKLVLHTTTELKELVDDNQKTYDTKNIMNEEFNDEIYDADTWAPFESAFETAQDSLEETDQRVINDAFADLEDAINGLKANDVVTKSQFRSAYNEYIDIVNDFEKYETWRRGTATVDANEVTFGKAATGNAKADMKKFKIKGAVLTFSEIKDIVYGQSKTLPASLMEDKANDYANIVTDNKTELTWITFGGLSTVSNPTFADDVKAAYDKFITNSNSNKTTLTGITKTYASMKKAVEVFKGWEVDNVKSGSKTSINRLLDDNHEALVKELIKANDSVYSAYITAIESGLGLSTGDIVVEKDATSNAATGKILINEAVPTGNQLLLDTNTGYVMADDTKYTDGTKTVTVKKGDDIAKYMPLNSTLAGTYLDGFNATNQTETVIKFSTALKAFEDVKAEDEADKKEKDFKAVLDKIITTGSETATTLDTQDNVTSSSTKSVAYPIVYRALKYAIDDMFPAATTYKKTDVANLIKDANKLIDDTGDASAFKSLNRTLDTARKNATAWVAAANATKGYKDGVKVEVTEGYIGYNQMNATGAYEDLIDAYDKLAKELKKLPVSFGEISDTIATVAEGLDADAYGASADAIATALADVSYDLSTLDWTENYEAYDDDRNFIFYNRLKTDGKEGEKAFYKKYQALLKAVEDATKAEDPDVVLGDADGDKVLTPKDAAQILKAYAQLVTLTDAQKKAADFNKDGNVDAKDALAILKSLAGIKE